MSKIEKIDGFYSREWRGSSWMKRQTAKLIRRLVKDAIRDETDLEPATLRHVTRGWTS